MLETHNRLVGDLCVLSALIGCFLFLSDLDEPLRFDRAIFEMVLLIPLGLWLFSRRARFDH